MRVISKKTLKQFWTDSQYADSEDPLTAWYREASCANWSNPADVKRQYGNASILKNGRVVFNISGNKYRLVVKINFNARIVYIRFIGTHQEYNQIDSQTI